MTSLPTRFYPFVTKTQTTSTLSPIRKKDLRRDCVLLWFTGTKVRNWFNPLIINNLGYNAHSFPSESKPLLEYCPPKLPSQLLPRIPKPPKNPSNFTSRPLTNNPKTSQTSQLPLASANTRTSPILLLLPDSLDKIVHSKHPRGRGGIKASRVEDSSST